jgi:hypothetical protein
MTTDRKVARRQRSPLTGKCSARPAGKPGYFHRSRRFATIPSPPLFPWIHTSTLRRLSMRFLRQAESIWSDVVSKSKSKPNTKPNPGARPIPPPVGRPRAQVKETSREDHAPSHRPQMSSDRLFLDRVGRHQSPSPLHRQPQNNMHSAEPWAKGDISTLPGRGHFYFALTKR